MESTEGKGTNTNKLLFLPVLITSFPLRPNTKSVPVPPSRLSGPLPPIVAKRCGQRRRRQNGALLTFNRVVASTAINVIGRPQSNRTATSCLDTIISTYATRRLGVAEESARGVKRRQRHLPCAFEYTIVTPVASTAKPAMPRTLIVPPAAALQLMLNSSSPVPMIGLWASGQVTPEARKTHRRVMRRVARNINTFNNQ